MGDKLFDLMYGARQFKNYIQKEIEVKTGWGRAELKELLEKTFDKYVEDVKNGRC